MDSIMKRAKAFISWFQGLEQARRMWFLAITGLALAGLVVAWQVATYERMVPLYDRPLDPATTNDIVNHLKSAEQTYSLQTGTGLVMVPDYTVESLRVELQGGGMVTDKNVGLELFEENRFGSTQFVEHVRYTRGLQGEIERQLNGLDPVRASKVLLSLPEESLFTEDVEPPSASVFLELKSGVTMSVADGASMAAMVASAVPRLDVRNVEIMDAEMRVIHAASAEEGEASVASSHAQLKRSDERHYKREIEGILERVVGPGKVVARVNVVLDNAQRTLDERKLHGDQAVAVVTRSEEKNSTQGTGEGGVPGTTVNIAEGRAANPVATGTTGESSEIRETGQYRVPETHKSEATLPGGIQSITAAVLVDGTWEAAAGDGAESADGEAAKTYAPRSEEELAAYTSLIASALGVAASSVTVVNQPFATVDVPAPTRPSAFAGSSMMIERYVRYGFAFLALLLTFGFIVRPVMQNITLPDDDEAETDPALLDGSGANALAGPGEQDEQALAALIARIGAGTEHISREEVSRLVSTDLTHSLVTLQAWLTEE